MAEASNYRDWPKECRDEVSAHFLAWLQRVPNACYAGALASFCTQPFEVLKTNRINSLSIYQDIHRTIVSGGWNNYMRGAYSAPCSSMAVLRQTFGFTLYTTLLARFESAFHAHSPSTSKFWKNTLSALPAKLIAQVVEAPITLLKTRMEVVGAGSLAVECRRLLESPFKTYCRGLSSSLAREGCYTFFHYNTYRWLKDDFLAAGTHATFAAALAAGLVAITLSQPFEVIRSQVSLTNLSMADIIARVNQSQGAKGYFMGFLPRLLRKPINSAICWTVFETLKAHSAEQDP